MNDLSMHIQRLEDMVDTLLHRGQGRAFTMSVVVGDIGLRCPMPFLRFSYDRV